MSIGSCGCTDFSLGNMGVPACADEIDVIQKIILMPYKNASGVRNGMVYATTWDAAYFSDKISQYKADASRNALADRWYPSPVLELVTNERSDRKYEDFPSGTKKRTSEGVRHFKGVIVEGASFALFEQMQRYGCSEIAALLVDKNNTIVGNKNAVSTQLSGIRIDKDSWNTRLVWADDDKVMKIEVEFDWHRLEKDQDLGFVKQSDYSAVDVLGLTGLYNVYGTLGTITQTTIIVSLYTYFGSSKTAQVISGLVAADIKLYNITDSAAVTVSTLVEDPLVPGKYTITFASQTVADVVQILIKKAGFDGGSANAVSPQLEALRATIV